ncbi:hypothetical protein LWI28_007008 [Acer negundo]|uniref:DUF4220 domain-containing protein n=1 Tax=Acer negundo TaxID=4023 RepID=A0AAD5IDR3_ACENE|nr:hypothetical protein LWI28_007008 [Acer negundo]
MAVLGQLPHLNILRPFSDSYRGMSMTCRSKGFPKLRALKLWKLCVQVWTVEEGAMPCLRELEIRSCQNLRPIQGLHNVTRKPTGKKKNQETIATPQRPGGNPNKAVVDQAMSSKALDEDTAMFISMSHEFKEEVVSSLMYSTNRRAILEVIPPRLRKLWKEWDLRLTILLSLILQLLLSILGNHRKHNRNTWIRILLWSAYTATDSLAIFAFGLLSNNLFDILEKGTTAGHVGHPYPSVQLAMFWAQFLLLHLGGPDSITAYDLEDNKLWLRQLLGLVSQTCGAINVFILAWTGKGSRLSILSILIFIAGFNKYGERTWVLREVSNQIRKKTVLKQHRVEISRGWLDMDIYDQLQ